MDTLIIPTFTHPENPRDNEIIGSYVEHDPSDPIWPDGCSTHEYVLAHVPKIITLTYGQILEHLLNGFVLDVGPEALDEFRTRFEKDTRFTEYTLEATPGYERSTVVSLEKRK
jgi:hypothetical protein